MRHALPAYLPIIGGLLLGTLVGLFVVDTDPAVAGLIFGAGVGLTGGAFIAGLVTKEPMVGSGGPRPTTYPGEALGQLAASSNAGNGSGDSGDEDGHR